MGGNDSAMLIELLKPLAKFINDVDLNEISVNRPCEVWVENWDGWKQHSVPELTYEHCEHIASLIANFNGKGVTSGNPVLSGSLPNGERVQVLIPPACEKGTVSITIRKPSVLTKTLDELESEGAFSQIRALVDGLQDHEHELIKLKSQHEIKKFLDLSVKSKQNILIVGQTGSGKTTVAKSLALSIPTHERLITIEDVRELFLDSHPNRVHLLYSRNDEAGHKVTPKQALASCLRMKPDRILLAELRGDEAWDYIKSINTGHAGSISTMHANGAREAFEQLTSLIKDSPTGAHLDSTYIKHRLYSTIDVVLFYSRRKLIEIYYNPEHKLSLINR
ncbi:MAG: P-type DNA transfer ATPase VirB11 [Methylococcaceae bacterium]|nr:P-type DNA transfer ATPase VirB11 [Methylococcaceae bacterium]